MENLFFILMAPHEGGGIGAFFPLLIIIAIISIFIFISPPNPTNKSKKQKAGNMGNANGAKSKAAAFQVGLIMVVIAIIAVIVSQTADFSYTTYETPPNPFGGRGMPLPVTKYNNDLKNALLYGGLLLGLTGAVIAIVSKSSTQQVVAHSNGVSKFCTKCGNKYVEGEAGSFCGKCGNKL